MADVFLAYKRKSDGDKATFIRNKLESLDVSVFQDVDIGIVESYSDYNSILDQELASAHVVVVIWTKESAGPTGRWVRAEADKGYNREVIVCCTFGDVLQQDLPLPYNGIQTPDLRRWFDSGVCTGDKACSAFLSMIGSRVNRPALSLLACTLEKDDDQANREFLHNNPNDKFSKILRDKIEKLERKEYDKKVKICKDNFDKYCLIIERKIVSLNKSFDHNLSAYLGGSGLAPSDEKSIFFKQFENTNAIICIDKKSIVVSIERAEQAEQSLKELQKDFESLKLCKTRWDIERITLKRQINNLSKNTQENNVKNDNLENSKKSRRISFLLIPSGLLVGTAVGLSFVANDQAQPLILGLLMLFALLGVFSLFAFVIGAMRFSGGK